MTINGNEFVIVFCRAVEHSKNYGTVFPVYTMYCDGSYAVQKNDKNEYHEKGLRKPMMTYTLRELMDVMFNNGTLS